MGIGVFWVGGESRGLDQRSIAMRDPDRAIGPVGRAVPLRQDEDTFARLGEPQPAEQPGQPSTDHDHIVGHHPSAT